MLDKKTKERVVDLINTLRSNHQAPAVVWDDKICQYAQEWADHLVNTCKFEHRPQNVYSENLGFTSGYRLPSVPDILEDTIQRWYSELFGEMVKSSIVGIMHVPYIFHFFVCAGEEKLYDYNKPGFSKQTGHFTTLVWKNTKRIGIALSFYPDMKKVVVVYNASPQSNVIGHFQYNVFDKKI